MRISIALPNTVPGADGGLLTEWAKRAEARGFASLAVTERLVYPGHDPLLTLAAAAAATSRIGLLTNVLIGPLRTAPVLAKSVATLATLSAGRLVLGLGPGVREDDFEAAGRSFAGRREAFEEQLELLGRGAAGEAAGPGAGPGVPVLVAGLSAAAVRRVVRWGDGWTAPGLEPEAVLPFAARVRRAWSEGGRSGAPRIVGLARFALGEDVERESAAFVRDYFSVLGAEAEEFVAKTPRTPERIRRVVAALADGGVDEVVMHPTAAALSQVDRLADVLLP
ncbi:LLM class flavin-dependent oxidoreductase [Streptomyces sp. NRRL B-1677]|uniref:LLM class flavin-dependent oxidoreductase n=1 Tax=Streptomyces klenkii TaxID=1420899 RepID=A0A3B0AZK5_9ACTN|nr:MULTISPECIES: LLM class flavin-dependent oxidoreductase [Streptomyces]MBF6047131.1 LLM class flavin-dependent oxidoreductase [Streptomyces sp. NRRL B-1677]RKN65832.1 LLM class flavin-dependent oxidoreductase [Streptomyces klenkii]